MTNNQYNDTLTIFFISYSLFEPLTQILLKRYRPSIFLPVIMVLWGICMTCMGLVHNFGGLMTARWFLGITEAGLFPGMSTKSGSEWSALLIFRRCQLLPKLLV